MDVLRTTDESRLPRVCGLSVDEFRQLFEAQNVDTADIDPA
jgi:hypothetical protein